MTASEYDAVPYTGRPFPQTHPDRLATIATLLGLRPASPTACRVLELGCGDGGNLLPMALGLPGSSFVGIDLAAGAIGRARAEAAALGLADVRFEAADLADHGVAPGGFDYVIAHGVYSWVAPDVRDALLAWCATALAPHGVAFVSYNALPGARLRQALWDMLRVDADEDQPPAARLRAARARLDLLLEQWPEGDPLVAALRAEAQRLRDGDDGPLFHDDLAPVNTPVLFRTLVEHAARHGLAYLGEADFFEMAAAGVPAALAEIGDPLEREQQLDFVKLRRFRQTLLCRAEAAPRSTADAAAIVGMAVSARLERVAPTRFAAPRGATLETDDPALLHALDLAVAAWPDAMPVAKLTPDPAARPRVLRALLDAYAAGLVELHVAAPRLASRPGVRPEASPLARRQAAAGGEVTSLRHTIVRLDGEGARQLVALLDGTRDRACLAAEMAARLGPGVADGDDVAAVLERGLTRLAALGLLLG